MTTTKKGRDWHNGYAFGFADNSIPYWSRYAHSAEFLQGYNVGKAEIDRLVEEADEARNSYER